MSTTVVTCWTCGRRDTFTADPPHGTTLPRQAGWQQIGGRDVCGKCAGTDHPQSSVGLALDTPLTE